MPVYGYQLGPAAVEVALQFGFFLFSTYYYAHISACLSDAKIADVIDLKKKNVFISLRTTEIGIS